MLAPFSVLTKRLSLALGVFEEKIELFQKDSIDLRKNFLLSHSVTGKNAAKIENVALDSWLKTLPD